MSVYIIRPNTSVARSGFVAFGKFTPESRKAQVREVINFWRKNPVYQRIQSWLKNPSSKVSILSHELGITGTTIVEMPDDLAQSMEQQFSDDLIILRDRPIELIQPVRNTGAEEPEKITSQLIKVARNSGGMNELPAKKLWHLKHINLIDEQGQRISQFTGRNITIAVLDTGIDSIHQEVRGKVIRSYQMNANREIVEVIPSGDTHGHGTHIAGLICGNQVGVAQNTQLIDCLVLPRGTANLSNLILWLDWLGLEEQVNVNIANISAGIPEYFPIIQKLIDTLLDIGILPVCAVGNDGFNNHIAPGNCKNSLSVGATNSNRQLAFFSGNGRMNVNYQLYDVPYLVAPGVQVYSSVPGGGYEAWDGTSMAAAIVSGVAALTLEQNMDIRAGSLINQLRSKCIDLGEERERQGRGLIQVP